jgi:hypothetical protein
MKYRAISWYVNDGAGGFRLFGFGIYWRDLRRSKILFSERRGYSRVFKVGNFVVKFLTP